ncbi:MAG: hypothetical protein ACFFG0_55985 [Candidatus Thorarchaeota archaeon]
MESEKFCGYCGAKIRSIAIYCDICGEKQPDIKRKKEIEEVTPIQTESPISDESEIDLNLLRAEYEEVMASIKQLIVDGKHKEVADKYQYLANLALELGEEKEAQKFIAKAKYFMS